MNSLLPKLIGSFINTLSIFTSKYAAHLSIKLFSSPKKGKTKPIEADYLKKAIQKDIPYNGLSIKTYHWIGTKETILLAHGWESNSYRWKDLIAILSKSNYNVIALDAPAHGSSGGKTFNALVYSECISEIAKITNTSVIVGHSVGGMASVFSQFNSYNGHVKKLILLGAPSNFTGVFSRYISLMGYNKKVITAMNQYVLENFNHLPEYFSASNFSKDFNIEGLVIHDKKDKIIPYQNGLDFKENYKKSKFISTSGFGHGLKSLEVYNHILEFIKA